MLAGKEVLAWHLMDAYNPPRFWHAFRLADGGPEQRPMKKPSRAKPANVAAVIREGLAHHRAGRLREAEAAYIGALWERPNHPDALQLLGVIAHQVVRNDVAVDLIRRAIAEKPDVAEFHNNLGAALNALGRADEAADACRRAVELKPKYPEAHFNLGAALKAGGAFDDALAAFRRAIRQRPGYREAEANIASIQLLRGDYGKGLKALAEQAGVPEPPPSPDGAAKRPWDGAPADGAIVLLYATGGPGDTLQFVRYAPLVGERGGRTVVTCQASLARLLVGMAGIDALAPEGAAMPHFDAYAALPALPHLFGTTVDTVPAAVPYLDADSDGADRWRGRIGTHDGLAVGLAWGESGGGARSDSAIPPAALDPLLGVPGVNLFALQAGKAPGDGDSGMVDLAADLTDFAEAAAALAALDLLITADAPIAHLAGAMGRPAWLLLPHVPDWRWMLEREDSPWYPSLRLFRQPEPGAWDAVIAGVRDALAARAGGGRA